MLDTFSANYRFTEYLCIMNTKPGPDFHCLYLNRDPNAERSYPMTKRILCYSSRKGTEKNVFFRLFNCRLFDL